MALVRCEEHKPDPKRTQYNYYTHPPVKPKGHPNPAVICGHKSCKEPGLVWLNKEEADAYRNGEHYFSTRSGFAPGIQASTGAKVRVE
jgi:hypothetical protein